MQNYLEKVLLSMFKSLRKYLCQAGCSTQDWCDHWKQCVWFIPGHGLAIRQDEELLLNACHTETSTSYTLKPRVPRTEVTNDNLDAGNFQLLLPPERIAIYGDHEWRHDMLTALQNTLSQRAEPLCIIADDSIFSATCVAHLSKTAKVLLLFPGLGDKGLQYLEAVANANGFSMDRVEILQKRKTCLTIDDTHQKKVDLVVGEPYYYGIDGMLPWQNLRFWKERTVLDPILAEDVSIMPCKGILKACAMSLFDLWNSRCGLSKIEGFDHTVVNSTLGACGHLPPPKEGPCLPFFIWQCGELEEVSEVFTIMEFDFSKPISQCHGKATVEFTKPGICHGFALWIDWVMDVENNIVISTGPDKKYWKQGVKLLASPVAVATRTSKQEDECSSALVEASFDPTCGELNIQHTFT